MDNDVSRTGTSGIGDQGAVSADLIEYVARAICGTDCKLSCIRGVTCRDGEPCQATSDQLFLSSVWNDAEAAVEAIAAASMTAPAEERAQASREDTHPAGR